MEKTKHDQYVLMSLTKLILLNFDTRVIAGIALGGHSFPFFSSITFQFLIRESEGKTETKPYFTPEVYPCRWGAGGLKPGFLCTFCAL